MIIVMKVGSPEIEIERVSAEFEAWGLSPEKIVGKHKVVIGLVGETRELDPLQIQELSPWIETVLRVHRFSRRNQGIRPPTNPRIKPLDRNRPASRTTLQTRLFRIPSRRIQRGFSPHS